MTRSAGLMALLGGLAVQACLLGWVLSDQAAPPGPSDPPSTGYRMALVIGGHVASSFACGLAFAMSMPAIFHRRGTFVLGSSLALLMPVGGPFCLSLIGALLLFRPLPPGDLLEEFKEHTTLPEVLDPVRFQTDRAAEMLQSHRATESLVDMLETPDPELKRAVLDAIARRRNPRLIAHIIKAVQDPRPEVYQFAMAQVLKLQEEYGGDIARAQESVGVSPDDVERHRKLADTYRRYLGSGLVDESLSGFYQGLLKKTYLRILDLRPGDLGARVALGRFALDVGDPEEAQTAFETALDGDPDDLEAQLGMIRSLFRQGIYREMFLRIRRLRDQIAQEGGDVGDLRQLTVWWLSPDDEVSATGSDRW